MRYANIIWQNTELNDSAFSAVNLGDNVQFLALEYIYEKLGIKFDEIIHLSLGEIRSYTGEEIILPLNWNIFDKYFIDEKFNYIFPKNVIPIFFGMSFSVYTDPRCFNKYNIDYLNKYGPVGCRDEYVYQQLTAHGINAYCNGCMTVTFPKRKMTGNTVILDDVPFELLQHIPKKILADAECLTQQVYIHAINQHCARDLAVQHYDHLLKSAKMVVTSRLHVAIPCMAHGIPVIFARKAIDTRFSFLDKLLPLYDLNNFAHIDWNPRPVYYEEQKQRMLEHAENMILRRHYDKNLTKEIHNFWIKRQKRIYCTYKESIYHSGDGIIHFLRHVEKRQGSSFNYMLWGVTDANKDICNTIAATFPQARLTGLIDSFKTVSYAGHVSRLPDDIIFDDNTVILVLAVGASNAARKLFLQRMISQDQYYLQGDLFITDEDIRHQNRSETTGLKNN